VYVAVIKIYKVFWTFTEQLVFTCRVYGSEDVIQKSGRILWTEWLEQHPGELARLETCGTSAHERGVD
jgi:hypothetical protein